MPRTSFSKGTGRFVESGALETRVIMRRWAERLRVKPPLKRIYRRVIGDPVV